MLDPESLDFRFDVFDFTEGRSPEQLCSYCNAVGHHFRICPDKVLPSLVDLPPPSPCYIEIQNHCFQFIQHSYQLSEYRLANQEKVREDMEGMLKTYWPDARLSLFGSSKNGFGLDQSDLDFCLRFEQPEIPEEIDPVAVIRRVAKCLSRNEDFKEIIPVTGAKVPIVKFFHTGINLEGDISLYNVLALRNTDLLYTYSKCDKRLVELGYVVKIFAKNCDIGDASKGSLSSYAFVIMMIHYLQRSFPPVLPVLQEIYEGSELHDTSEFTVDGWNTYFFDKPQKLEELRDGYRKNRESCAELWMGFLRYFTEVFSFENDVIQIRQSAKLTKFEKLWTDKPMALEDPFELSHNLASGLSKKMFNYIRRCLIRAREVFGKWDDHVKEFRDDLKGNGQYLENFFMIRCRLQDQPPQDRQCRFCRRVGHFVENCPLRKNNRKQTIDEGGETWELEYEPRPSAHQDYSGHNVCGNEQGQRQTPVEKYSRYGIRIRGRRSAPRISEKPTKVLPSSLHNVQNPVHTSGSGGQSGGGLGRGVRLYPPVVNPVVRTVFGHPPRSGFVVQQNPASMPPYGFSLGIILKLRDTDSQVAGQIEIIRLAQTDHKLFPLCLKDTVTFF